MLLHSVDAGLTSHLTDSPPDASEKDTKAWRDVDDRVMAILAMNADPTIRYSMEYHAAFMKLSSQIQWCQSLIQLARSVVSGKSMSSKIKIFHFMMRLRSEFEPVTP
jgi:hypothetical protein